MRHAGKLNRPLPERQSQRDVINLIKQYIRELDFDVHYHHFHAHLNKVMRWDQLMDIQKLIIECNKLANEALLKFILIMHNLQIVHPFFSSSLDGVLRPAHIIFAAWLHVALAMALLYQR